MIDQEEIEHNRRKRREMRRRKMWRAIKLVVTLIIMYSLLVALIAFLANAMLSALYSIDKLSYILSATRLAESCFTL